jgi:hypothetical protein
MVAHTIVKVSGIVRVAQEMLKYTNTIHVRKIPLKNKDTDETPKGTTRNPFIAL